MQDLSLPSSSPGLELIDQILQHYNRLLLKEETCKLQLDQQEGQELFRVYMGKVENIVKETKADIENRSFRSSYTNAYRVLYQDGTLGYIPEIYDSAQQGFPFIYVNGEQFDFSSEVLILGERLVQSFFKLVHQFRVASLRGEGWKQSVKLSLQQFDLAWTCYEQKYIGQLIRIQQHSKSAIRLIIEVEAALFSFQNQQKLKGRIFLSGFEYDQLRRHLCQKISRLNAVANIDGKGRDDLTFQVLAAAENVLATVTDLQSRSVRVLAQRIRQSFQNVREVLRFFQQNFEMVDPQLKNNPELVAALQEYESYWEKGKRYFLQPQKENQIVALSSIVQAAREKYANFKQLLEFSDPSVFWIIPSLIVLRSLQGQDEGLAQSFLQGNHSIHKKGQYLSLKSAYFTQKGGASDFSLYNRLEQLLIGESQEILRESVQLGLLVNKIKEVAVGLQRICPMDWNDMLGVLLLEHSE